MYIIYIKKTWLTFQMEVNMNKDCNWAFLPFQNLKYTIYQKLKKRRKMLYKLYNVSFFGVKENRLYISDYEKIIK